MARKFLTNPIIPEPVADDHAATKLYAKNRIHVGPTAPTDDDALWIKDDEDSSALAISPTIFGAKGEILVGTGDGTFEALGAAPGNGYGLFSDASQPGGVGWVAPTKLTALQTGFHGPGVSAWIPGMALSIPAGRWKITARMRSIRKWCFGATGSVNFYWSIARQSDGLVFAEGNLQVGDGLTERQEAGPSIDAIVTLGETTTVSVWGNVQMVTGSNFASGFRWDSPQFGAQSVLVADRIG